MSTDEAGNRGTEQILETARLAELGLNAAQLVHELRQPLFAAKSLVDLLVSASSSVDTVSQERLSLVAEQLGLLDLLLRRYGLAGRRSTAQAQRLALVPLIAAAVDMMRAHAVRSRVVLSMVVTDGGALVMADSVGVQQIAGNLIRNALDAATSSVVVRVHRDGVDIEDDGGGFELGGQVDAFQPFYTTKPPGQGTGLGLGLARHLVESVGGTLQFVRRGDTTVAEVRFRAIAPATSDPAISDPETGPTGP